MRTLVFNELMPDAVLKTEFKAKTVALFDLILFTVKKKLF